MGPLISGKSKLVKYHNLARCFVGPNNFEPQTFSFFKNQGPLGGYHTYRPHMTYALCRNEVNILPEAHIAPENRVSQKESSVPTGAYAVSFREDIGLHDLGGTTTTMGTFS